jgi:hypothetical protein
MSGAGDRVCCVCESIAQTPPKQRGGMQVFSGEPLVDGRHAGTFICIPHRDLAEVHIEYGYDTLRNMVDPTRRGDGN